MNTVQLDAQTRFRLTLVYGVWAALLIILGTQALLQVTAQIDSTYGGFIWTHDPTRQPPFYVSFELWRSLPPTPTEIRFLDEIVTIDGRSPWAFGEVYDQADPGDLVSYLVRRGGNELLIQEHVRIFTFDKFVLGYGLLYLAGLAYVVAGFFLLRSTERRDFALFAFAFLFGGGAWLSHSGILGIHAPYEERPIFNLILYTPAMPMVGAILLHFVALYPTPKRRILRCPLFPWGPYLIAFILIIGYTLTRNLTLARMNRILLVGMFLYAIIAMLMLMIGSLITYWSARRRGDDSQRRILEPMIIASIVGFTIFVVLGMLPVLLLKYTLLPFEIWITLVMILPLVFVYAMRNGELIDRLRREAVLRRQYGDQVEELRNIRERTLHEVADALHDQVIPELRGLHFAAAAAQRQADAFAPEQFVGDLAFISDTLNTVSIDVRTIMEGAKPVDWDYTELPQALCWLADGLQRNNQRLRLQIDVEDYDNRDGPPIKESLYWIARAALSNVQDHARASEVRISLRNDEVGTVLIIEDNGVGFDSEGRGAERNSERRHLGLTNMRLRAAEIAAQLSLESSPGQGTRITVIVPRGENV